jgi:hypothetical protein
MPTAVTIPWLPPFASLWVCVNKDLPEHSLSFFTPESWQRGIFWSQTSKCD